MRKPRMNYILVVMIVWIFYYFIFRILKIFNLHLSNRIILAIATVLSLAILFTIMYHGNNKFLDIVWTISSRIFVLCFFIAAILVCEQIIWKRYKINPRIIIWFIVIILWIWTYFSLKNKITTYEINTDKINKDTKILLVSDIHVDHIYKDFHVKKIQKMIESEKPDFVLIAWDMMNKANENYPKYFQILQKKESPIFAVMWNHDVMWNKEAYKKIEKIWNIRLLNNQAATFLNGVTLSEWCNAGNSFENCTWTIQIVWIKDKSVRWNKNIDQIIQESISNLSQKYNDNNFTILITHQPISLEKLKNYPIDLEVAGHTHHGQIFWLRKLTEIVNDYWYWKFEEDWKTAIVTQWIWTRWLPFRLGTQSEMVIINLKKN